MLKKALGYKVTESTTEYVVDKNGERKAVREKKQTKFYPPDPSALKSYLDLTGREGEFEGMSDEELEAELKRLLEELR